VVLDPAQVRGIQRLTASAVPELEEKNVSVMDETGVILSARDIDDDAAPVGGRLAQKQAVEKYLADKVRTVLSQALGAQRFAVSVDATLDLTQKTTTTERVLEAANGGGVKRIKESSRAGKGEQGGDDRQKEVEYDLGREVEQVVQGVGGIRRVQVGVIIDRDVGAVNIDELREVISTAVGADTSRGDKVTVMQHGVAVQRAIESLQPPPLAPASKVLPARELATLRAQPIPQWTWVVLAFLIFAAAGAVSVKRNADRAKQLRRQELRRRLTVWAEGSPVEAPQS
jgi:flagellar M-ring protein FliF